MYPVLSVAQLRKVYGPSVAVDGISFQVHPGEIVGLLGSNGAGKTTTINMILGVLVPTSGTILINGFDISKERSKALRTTNFAAVYAPLPGNLTLIQNLKIFGMLYGVTNLSERLEELLKQFHLEKFRNTRCGLLSSGEQTRATLAKAMLNRPQLLLLDEPTASLDPSVAQELWVHIREFAALGTGIVWTSHNMREVEEVCDRLLLLSQTKIRLEGDPKRLPQLYGKANLDELFVTVARDPHFFEKKNE